MAFVKKGAPKAIPLNDPVGFAQKYQNAAGNTDVDLSSPDYCYSSGLNPVNSQGQVTNKTGKVMNWPSQKFTVDNELNPRSNEARPEPLSTTPQTYGDFDTAGKRVSNFGTGLLGN